MSRSPHGAGAQCQQPVMLAIAWRSLCQAAAAARAARCRRSPARRNADRGARAPAKPEGDRQQCALRRHPRPRRQALRPRAARRRCRRVCARHGRPSRTRLVHRARAQRARCRPLRPAHPLAAAQRTTAICARRADDVALIERRKRGRFGADLAKRSHPLRNGSGSARKLSLESQQQRQCALELASVA